MSRTPGGSPEPSGEHPGAIETVSILFTDVVGSTAMAARVGPDRAERAMAEHFALLREAVAAAGGREVKNLGDGLMVVFPSAVAAVRCAVRMQQLLECRSRTAAEPLAIRVGVSLGDASREDGDYFGEPVVQAARLCGHAAGDQILCSALVRMMVGARDDVAFSRVGELALKGLPESVDAFQVAWTPLADTDDTVELPPALRSLPATQLVGRETEQARLQECWRDALNGRPRIAFVSGEPGIGKTRLATTIAGDAHSAGAVVLYGRCEQDLGIPYRPWVEALSHYVRVAPLPLLREHVRRHGGELARVVGALSLRLPDIPAPGTGDQEAARFSFFAAAADLLEAVGAEHPLVVVLDDLHWADRESILLLAHLAVSPLPQRRLFECTFRDSEVTVEHPLSALLAQLHREPGTERLRLDGLHETEVVALMQARAGHDLDSAGIALAGELTRETGGNPFFVGELLRHLFEQGAIKQDQEGRWRIVGGVEQLGLPQSVREVVLQRVGRLGRDASRTLSVASVLGRSFELDLLARVLGVGVAEVLDVLEQAVAIAVLRESVGEPGRFYFSHALVEHALYGSLSATRRAHLHQRVGETLEDLGAGRSKDRIAQLAHHFAAAVRPAAPEKAIDYACQAGQHAIEQLAPGEARRWFERGLELCERCAHRDEGIRCELLIGLGQAQRQSGVPEFRRTLLDAAGLAATCGEGERVARAVLATSRGLGSVSRPDEELIDLLRTAHEALPDDHPLQARVVALLASELTYSVDVATRRTLAEKSVVLARAHGDPHTLAFVLLYYVFALWFPDTLAERMKLSAELIRAAQAAADPPLLFHAAARCWSTFMEDGDIDAAERCLDQMRAVVDATPQPLLRWRWLYHLSTRELLAGRSADAEALADECESVGTTAGEADATTFHAVMLAAIRRGQGRLSELTDELADWSARYAGFSVLPALHALALCEAGAEREAAARLQSISDEQFRSIASNAVWMTSMMLWSEVAARVNDRRAATMLYTRLEPFADHVAATAIVVSGSVAYALGLLAVALGRPAEAEAHFSRAIAVNERLRAPLLLERVRSGRARVAAPERQA